MFALCISAALAAERLVWELRYLGMPVGVAEASIEESPSGLRNITATARSAEWYSAVYPVDDRIVSLSRVDGGSVRYTASYREGDRAVDVDMRLDGAAYEVHRSKRTDAGWTSWSDSYPRGAEAAEDALSALVSLRHVPLEPGARYAVPVFTGKQVVTLHAVVLQPTLCDERPCVPVRLSGGDEGREMLLHVSDDADRLPLRATVRASGVKVEATLVHWSADE